MTPPLRLVIVGGGAAGVEVGLNFTGRFQGRGRLHDLDPTLIEQETRLLPGFPDDVQTYAPERLRGRGASVRTTTTVRSVDDREGTAEICTETERGPSATLRVEAPVSCREANRSS